ncbi:MAG: alpha-isopropylmalate synthase regulatory domain-containing protein, partial [Pseudomonadota bacterium]
IMPYATGIDSTRIMQASRLISGVTGFPVQFNKAVVGKNAFAHEAGIHQDGMLKHAGTYEIMLPEDVGLTESTLAMGKHSGRHALKSKLSDLGFDVGDNQLKSLFVRFKALADRKKEVYDDDIVALVEEETADAGAEHIKLKFLRVICGTEAPQSADIILEIDGEEKSVTAQGDGPVDAAFACVKELVPHDAKLELYQVHAVTQGTDAQATVSVRMREGDKLVTAQSSDTDTVVASCRAYVHALNKLMVRRAKTAPVSMVS